MNVDKNSTKLDNIESINKNKAEIIKIREKKILMKQNPLIESRVLRLKPLNCKNN